MNQIQTINDDRMNDENEENAEDECCSSDEEDKMETEVMIVKRVQVMKVMKKIKWKVIVIVQQIQVMKKRKLK